MFRGLYRYLMICGVVLTMVLTACGEAAPTATPVPTPAPPTNTAAPPTATVPAATPTTATTPTPAAMNPQQIAQALRPATVLVKATFGETAINAEGLGAGTGIVYDADNGYIITNNHVVEGASAIQVYQANSSRGRAARVVGRAQCDDLAVLKVDDTSDLKAAPLGDTTKLDPGAPVVALGYPQSFELGGDLTVATGVVSKLKAQMDQYQDLVQTDAKITHGNSGGPLVNDRGEVIGINTLGFYSSSGEREQGINFAISMSYAKNIVRDLQAGKNRNYIGLNLFPNVPDFKNYFGTDDGMVIIGVASGGPGDQAGIQPADLILKIEGTSISYQNGTSRDKQICDILRSHADGDPLKIQVERPSTRQILEGEVTLGKGNSSNKMSVVADLSGSNNGGSNGGNNSGDQSATPSGSQSGNSSADNVTILKDSKFSGGDADGWPVQDGDGYSQSVSGGYYTLDISKSDTSISAAPAEGAGLSDGAVVASVRAQGQGWAGVIARYNGSGDSADMYFCGVNAADQFFCAKRSGGQLTTLAKPQSNSAIKANDFNVLTLLAKGNQVSFVVNDTTLGTFTESDLQSGSWGVLATTEGDSTAFKAQYEEIAIAKPK